MEINNRKVVINKETIDKIAKELSKDNGNKIKAGYLTGTIKSDKIIVEGVYVPKQESNEVLTTISSEEESRAFADIKNHGKSGVGFAQYHSLYPVYESATTRMSREQLAQRRKLPNLCLVVNQKRDYGIFK
ncbi:MAG: hypothetical protein KJ968_00705 [Nanoarchaeota archaeon]|nr:hypothetical protein [Nanoarchaeota archaeon]MBU4283604.1 hypothetical protein [Nanoarchaeota archaeon]